MHVAEQQRADVGIGIDRPLGRRRADARAVVDTMRRVSGAEPTIWGGSIIGFGHEPYTTSDGKERDWFAIDLSPRKAAVTLYGLT
jgi:hypothetical protein